MNTLLVAGLAVLLSQPGPLKIVVIEGEGAVNIIQQKTAVAPVIEVRDRNNLPVPGAVVTFTISGGKQAAFAGGSQTLTVTTNAAGRAAASAVSPLNSGAVQIQVQATFQGQTAAATIAQTNVVAAGGGLGGLAVAGIVGGVGAAGGAVLLAKNTDDDDGIVSDPSPVAEAAGTYALQTINGIGLPAVGVTSPPATCAVIFDNVTLTLAAGPERQFEVIENSRTDCPVGTNSTFRSSTIGTWAVSGNTVTFQHTSQNVILDTATLNGATLTMTVVFPHSDRGTPPRVNTTWRK
jgi:hypothetical protein